MSHPVAPSFKTVEIAPHPPIWKGSWLHDTSKPTEDRMKIAHDFTHPAPERTGVLGGGCRDGMGCPVLGGDFET